MIYTTVFQREFKGVFHADGPKEDPEDKIREVMKMHTLDPGSTTRLYQSTDGTIYTISFCNENFSSFIEDETYQRLVIIQNTRKKGIPSFLEGILQDKGFVKKED